MKTERRRLSAGRVCFATVGGLIISCGGDGSILQPSLPLWCGEQLCDWTVEAGRVERVSTWHPTEPGLRFVEAPTVLSQLVPDGVRCLRFEVLAHVDPEAQLLLELDFLDDGVAEVRQQISGSAFDRWTYSTPTPSWYQDLRLSLRLQTQDEVRLARLKVLPDPPSSDCSGSPPTLQGRPLGASCEANEQCASGACVVGDCG